MREILFRGKRLDNGEWVYGDLLHGDQAVNEHKVYILHGFPIEVDPATVGQYTGLTDKDGTKIFEGDILVWGNKGTQGRPLVVEFDCGAFGYRYCGSFYAWAGNENFTFRPFNTDSRFEIIGNIHDNQNK